jgi:hypothetical protein
MDREAPISNSNTFGLSYMVCTWLGHLGICEDDIFDMGSNKRGGVCKHYEQLVVKMYRKLNIKRWAKKHSYALWCMGIPLGWIGLGLLLWKYAISIFGIWLAITFIIMASFMVATK